MIRKLIASAAIVTIGVSVLGASSASALNTQPIPPETSAFTLDHTSWVTVNPQPLPPRIFRISVRGY